MLKLNSDRKFKIKQINFVKLLNCSPIDFGLVRDYSSELFIYKSLGFKILFWNIKPKIYFSLIKGNDYIRLKLDDNITLGIPKLSELVTVYIDTKITNSSIGCFIDRSINLGIYNTNSLIRFFPDQIKKSMMKDALRIISARFDTKLTKQIIKISRE